MTREKPTTMSFSETTQTNQQQQQQQQQQQSRVVSTVLPHDDSDSSATVEVSVRSGAWEYLTASVRPSHLVEFELVILTFCTGLQDAISFPDYHCFASNQTGNTIFLTLAIILPELNGEMFILGNIGVALGFFLAGSWLTGQLSHIIGVRCRLWLICCNFIQTALVFAAAALQYVHGVQLQGTMTLIIIALLAFASGSQVVQSRSFAMTEISTAMATAAWVDLVIDPNLLVLKNRGRNRRVFFLLTLVVGALVGAWIYKTAGSATAIAVSGVGKFIVTIMYFFNSAEKRKVESSQVNV